MSFTSAKAGERQNERSTRRCRGVEGKDSDYRRVVRRGWRGERDAGREVGDDTVTMEGSLRTRDGVGLEIGKGSTPNDAHSSVFGGRDHRRMR